MTANKESLFWKSNKEWYKINSQGKYELTEKAPLRAIQSFKLYQTKRKELN